MKLNGEEFEIEFGKEIGLTERRGRGRPKKDRPSDWVEPIKRPRGRPSIVKAIDDTLSESVNPVLPKKYVKLPNDKRLAGKIADGSVDTILGVRKISFKQNLDKALILCQFDERLMLDKKYSDTIGMKPLVRIALAYLQKAVDGDVNILKDLINRIDGRVAQSIDVTSDGKSLLGGVLTEMISKREEMKNITPSGSDLLMIDGSFDSSVDALGSSLRLSSNIISELSTINEAISTAVNISVGSTIDGDDDFDEDFDDDFDEDF